MERPATIAAMMIALCLTGAACSPTRPADPFVGFFADPNGAALDLSPGDVPGTYGGWIYGDAKLPVRLKRSGDALRGFYGNRNWSLDNPDQPLVVRDTPEGLVLIDGGDRYDNPLKWYPSKAAFERSPEGRSR